MSERKPIWYYFWIRYPSSHNERCYEIMLVHLCNLFDSLIGLLSLGFVISRTANWVRSHFFDWRYGKESDNASPPD